MSISRNVGGMSTYLSALRTAEAYTGMKMGVTKALKKVPKVGTALVDTMRKTKSSVKQLFIPGMLFENMGLTYLGPVDGHNMRQMMKLFNEAKRVEGPVVVHVLTKKGRGYEPASAHPDRFMEQVLLILKQAGYFRRKQCRVIQMFFPKHWSLLVRKIKN